MFVATGQLLHTSSSRKSFHLFIQDIDELSLKYAKMNIENNNLSDRITLVKSDPSGPILPISSKDDIVYDFIMCNPPFYSDREEVLRSAEAKEFEPNAVSRAHDLY